MTKSVGLALKIPLLVPKPTGHLVPRGRHNVHLWVYMTVMFGFDKIFQCEEKHGKFLSLVYDLASNGSMIYG